MRRFTQLFISLDETNKTNQKVAAIVRYLHEAPPADAAWAVYFLMGRRLKRLVKVRDLQSWCLAATDLPEWLFLESYEAVGDLAETIALIMPDGRDVSCGVAESLPLHLWIEQRLLELRTADAESQPALMLAWWAELPQASRLVLNKLITGGFRIGVSQRLVIRAISQAFGIEPEIVADRLMGDWTPDADFFQSLISLEASGTEHSRPYPFMLAQALEGQPNALGDIQEWQAEWKWDGIRAQLIRRAGQTIIWSRGEERLDGRFPEVEQAAVPIPDGTVLDGEILACRQDDVLPFATLQKRIGRKSVGKRLLADAPVAYFAFDLLELNGEDVRNWPMHKRRECLEQMVAHRGAGPSPQQTFDDKIRVAPMLYAESWEELARQRQDARSMRTEGLMLKRRDSAYQVGRPRGVWWKWKIEPQTIDAVLIYAQAGSGRRASLFTDYTFALWNEDELVPFAKAYSGLTDEEIREVDQFVRQHTLQRFGPVRQVAAELVFELAFENIQRSSRHKSGVAVRFPRIVRWRRDLGPRDADTLSHLKSMMV